MSWQYAAGMEPEIWHDWGEKNQSHKNVLHRRHIVSISNTYSVANRVRSMSLWTKLVSSSWSVLGGSKENCPRPAGGGWASESNRQDEHMQNDGYESMFQSQRSEILVAPGTSHCLPLLGCWAAKECIGVQLGTAWLGRAKLSTVSVYFFFFCEKSICVLNRASN